MKRLKKTILIVFLLSVMLFLLAYPKVFASNSETSLQPVEYTEEFKKWLETPNEEREDTIQPRAYKLLNTKVNSTSIPYNMRLLTAGLNASYTLKTILPYNLVIRDQQDTETCWAFAALSSLETNLALRNLAKSNLEVENEQSKKYHYSVRHMDYATSKTFKDGINERGYNRAPGSGGNWIIAETYFTSGLGPIDEEEMPFINSKESINLSSIQNKTVTAQVQDTVEFANYNEATTLPEKQEIMNKIKQHIQNYGSVYASMYGGIILSDCCNAQTGALYCNDSDKYLINHAVGIVGWDDNYSKSNFLEGSQPSSDGAWIVRNSYGERPSMELSECKTWLFDAAHDQLVEAGYTSPEQIPNSVLEANGFVIEENIAYYSISGNGYIYVSYEDCNIATTLYGIEKATDEVEDGYLYQYDYFYPLGGVIVSGTNTAMICNVFDKQGTETEYLTQVSIRERQSHTCKVYVNPNGSSKAKEDLQLVQLKSGETETNETGYHTLEFAEPVEIKGSQFVVLIEAQSTSDTVEFMQEVRLESLSEFDQVTVENNKCFIAIGNDLDNCTWNDMGTLGDDNLGDGLNNGDSTIKAFTVKATTEEPQPIITRIEITTPPSKTEYKEGESFDKTGMVVTAVYDNGDREVLSSSDYTVTNGTDLQESQTSVTISYEGKTATQSITVTKEATPPPVTEVEKAESFDVKDVRCTVKVKAYVFTDTSKQSYLIMDTNIDNITRYLSNDKLEYYYYLSSNANENNITEWIQITEKQTDKNKLEFKIDTRNTSNYKELQQGNDLYLYVKEVAIKGEDKATEITKAIKLSTENATEMEVYIDGVKYDNTDQTTTNNNANTEKLPSKLPYAGIRITITILIIGILGASMVFYTKYRKLNRYIK